MSVDAKDDGKSPPVPPGEAPSLPARKPAPPLPPIGPAPAKPKLPPPIAGIAPPPKPAGGPPKLVVPPPAAAVPRPPAPIAAPPPAPFAPPPPASIAPPPAAPQSVAAPRPVAAKVPLATPAPQPEPEPPASIPPLEISVPMTTAELDARASRSTMEFLFELDSPLNPPTSREMDLRTMPEVEAALAASSTSAPPATVEVAARISMPELPMESLPPPGMAPDDAIAVETDALASAPRQLPRITLRAQPPANTAEEQLEARRRRVIARLVTCRDVFRALGYLEIRESDRKDVARLLMGLDDALEPARKNLGVAKDPAAVLSGATKEEIDRIERLISPIEDKLLQLDDFVPDAMFASRVDNGKITPKMLARYGRLLGSRRIQAGPRRDRFEWIATALLSRKTKDGQRALVGAERATQALELMIGGLPFKPKEQDLEEAIVFLTDALERLTTFSDQEAFFDSEFFIDVHGYKVSMRELLLSPDFVYLSVAINVRLHNRMEQWIASMERVHKSNQLTQEGSPRDKLMRRLREAEDAVGSIFNVKPRAAAAPPARIESKAPASEPRSSLRPRTSKKPAKKKSGFDFDRRALAMVVLGLMIIAIGGWLAYQQGYIQFDPRRDLPAQQVKQVSPRIVRSYVTGSGKDQVFHGMMNRPAWREMSPTERRQEADRIVAGLRRLGITKGTVLAGKTTVIEIKDGLIVSALYEGNP